MRWRRHATRLPEKRMPGPTGCPPPSRRCGALPGSPSTLAPRRQPGQWTPGWQRCQSWPAQDCAPGHVFATHAQAGAPRAWRTGENGV